MRMAFRADNTPRYPQASVLNVERSECPPLSVLWPVRYCFERIPEITQANEPFGLQTEPSEAMAKQLLWMSLTSS